MKDPQEVVFWISDACKRYYGDRLHAVLHIGSSSSAISGHTDIDLIIVLNDRETFKDMVTLRNILNEYDFIFDVQILNLEYIDQRIFSHFSHGQFFALFLSRATVLFGSNPFGGLRVSRADVIVSVIQKMQYYYFRAKGCVLENKYRGILKKNEFRYHRKKILFMLIDYYLAEEDKISMLRNKRFN